VLSGPQAILTMSIAELLEHPAERAGLPRELGGLRRRRAPGLRTGGASPLVKRETDLGYPSADAIGQ
jgi:hypothetical protein